MKHNLFLIVTAIMIILPGIFTKFGKDRISEIDNRKLAEFETAEGDTVFQKADRVLEDRVGFREELITVNEVVTDTLFHKLVHPFYIYGRKGHLFTEWDLETFQHMKPQEGYDEEFGAYIKSIRDYCESIGTQFVFVMPPNKESIYPEYYAEGYNIADGKSRSELVIEELKRLNTDVVYPKEEFLKLKENEVLYNKIFDVGHWNETGLFYACRDMFALLDMRCGNIPELREEDFKLRMKEEKYMLQSMQYKPDMVPLYEYKYNPMKNDAKSFYNDGIALAHNQYMYHGTDEENRDKPRILVVEDSYFGQMDAYKFFYGKCSELFMIHAMNEEDLEYYLSVIRPDIFIFECCERGLEDDGLYSFNYVKKRLFTEGVNDDLFNVSKADPSEIGLEDSYIFVGKDREYVSISGDYPEGLKWPSIPAARVNGKWYFGHDEDFFNSDRRKVTFTFRVSDIEKSGNIEYYLIYQKRD